MITSVSSSPSVAFLSNVPFIAAVEILRRHMDFILACGVFTITEGSTQILVSQEATEFLSSETVRGMLEGIVDRGRGLLSESSALWQLWLEWEISLWQGISADQK